MPTLDQSEHGTPLYKYVPSQINDVVSSCPLNTFEQVMVSSTIQMSVTGHPSSLQAICDIIIL